MTKTVDLFSLQVKRKVKEGDNLIKKMIILYYLYFSTKYIHIYFNYYNVLYISKDLFSV